MKKDRTLRQALPQYIPADAVEPVAQWFDSHFVVLRISRTRTTKYGDFKASQPGEPGRISVNHDLNPYSFLITLLHEMAHAEVFINYAKRMQPHGKAWKLAFRKLAMPYIEAGIFPDNLGLTFSRYLLDPKASTSTYTPLVVALRGYDNQTDHITVAMLEPDSVFALPDGRKFKVVEKLRKRYRCYCFNNKRTYLFNPLAVISPVEVN